MHAYSSEILSDIAKACRRLIQTALGGHEKLLQEHIRVNTRLEYVPCVPEYVLTGEASSIYIGQQSIHTYRLESHDWRKLLSPSNKGDSILCIRGKVSQLCLATYAM
jgi:hypothetical protein